MTSNEAAPDPGDSAVSAQQRAAEQAKWDAYYRDLPDHVVEQTVYRNHGAGFDPPVVWPGLTGALIQRITGQPLGDVIRDELEKPLELDGIYIGAPPEAKARAAQLGGRPGSSRSGIMDRIFFNPPFVKSISGNCLIGGGLCSLNDSWVEYMLSLCICDIIN